jgi:diamine N-acetyltransferase
MAAQGRTGWSLTLANTDGSAIMTFRRVYSQADIATVSRLACEIWNEHYVSIIGQAQVDYMLERFQSQRAIRDQIDSGTEYYLIIHQRKAVGYVGVVPEPTTASLLLSKIYVRKQSRGLRLGKLALGFTEELCRQRNIRTIWLTVNKQNKESIAWYERMGFTSPGPAIQDIGEGFVMDDFKFEKSVDHPGDLGIRLPQKK